MFAGFDIHGGNFGAYQDATQGCVGWRLTWTVTGFSGATIQIEGSQDNSSWVAFSGAVVIEGSNPTLLDGGNRIEF